MRLVLDWLKMTRRAARKLSLLSDSHREKLDFSIAAGFLATDRSPNCLYGRIHPRPNGTCGEGIFEIADGVVVHLMCFSSPTKCVLILLDFWLEKICEEEQLAAQ